MKNEKLINGQTCHYVGPISNEQYKILNPSGSEVIMSGEKIDGTWHYWVEETFALPYLKIIDENRNQNKAK